MQRPETPTVPAVDLTGIVDRDPSRCSTPGDNLQDIITEAIRRLRPVGRRDTSTSPRTSSSWLLLPTDLVAVIALHCGQKHNLVPVMRLVCKDWRDALDAACVQLKPRVLLHGDRLAARYRPTSGVSYTLQCGTHRFPRVEVLDLSTCKHLQGAHLAHLAHWTGLKALILDVCIRLNSLDTTHDVISSQRREALTDDALAHLRALTGLQHVSLRNCYKTTDAAMHDVASLPALEVCEVLHTVVTHHPPRHWT